MKRTPFLTCLAAAVLLTPALTMAQPPAAGPEGPEASRVVEREVVVRGPERMASRQDTRLGQRRIQRNRQARRPDLALDLGLSEAQKADIGKVREGARRDRLRKSTDLKIARMDLNSLLRAEKVDEKAVGVKLAEVQAAQGALLKLRVDSALAMKRILTPEQQKKMTEMRGQRDGMSQARPRMPAPGRRERR